MHSVIVENRRLAMSLRRRFLQDFECLCVRQVDIKENTTFIPSDILAHRISQIPVYCEEKVIQDLCSVCSCASHCDKCSVYFYLKTSKPGRVLSCEFECANKDVRMRHDRILIAEIQAGDTLEVRAICKKAPERAFCTVTVREVQIDKFVIELETIGHRDIYALIREAFESHYLKNNKKCDC